MDTNRNNEVGIAEMAALCLAQQMHPRVVECPRCGEFAVSPLRIALMVPPDVLKMSLNRGNVGVLVRLDNPCWRCNSEGSASIHVIGLRRSPVNPGDKPRVPRRSSEEAAGRS